jgi:hypothetical protein
MRYRSKPSSRRYVVTGVMRAGVALLLAVWLLGVMFGVGGSLINVLLLLAGVGIESSSRPVAGRSGNTRNLSRQDSSDPGRSEDKIAA